MDHSVRIEFPHGVEAGPHRGFPRPAANAASAGANRRWDTDHLWERLIGDPRTFARHWGREPLQRVTDEDFTSLFGIDDVEELLTNGLRRPAFRLVRDGVTLPDSACTRSVRLGGRDLDDVADVERIAAAFVDGATVVLQGLHRTQPRVAEFTHALERTSGHPIQVNAYLTPPSAHGLAAHRDSHDVLVLHVMGEKQWHVHGLGDVVLRPGHVLYVPAGVEHAAETTDAATLHLTVGVLRVSLRQIIGRLLGTIDGLEQPAPLRFVGPDRRAFVEALSHAMHTVSAELARIDPEQVARDEVHRAGRRAARSTLGLLTSLSELPTLDGSTRISLRPGCQVCRDGEEHVRLEREGRSLRIPIVAAPALELLARTVGCRVDDLPALDRDSRLVLARRLVRERLATTSSPTPRTHAAAAVARPHE